MLEYSRFLHRLSSDRYSRKLSTPNQVAPFDRWRWVNSPHSLSLSRSNSGGFVKFDCYWNGFGRIPSMPCTPFSSHDLRTIRRHSSVLESIRAWFIQLMLKNGKRSDNPSTSKPSNDFQFSVLYVYFTNLPCAMHMADGLCIVEYLIETFFDCFCLVSLQSVTARNALDSMPYFILFVFCFFNFMSLPYSPILFIYYRYNNFVAALV